MHELGVVFYVIKEVEKVCVENNVTQVKSVTVDLGEVSTVIPYYLQDVWKWASVNRSTYLKTAELKVNTVPAITYCEDCQQEYGTVEHGRTCPYCGSEHTYLKQGNEFTIKEIEAM